MSRAGTETDRLLRRLRIEWAPWLALGTRLAVRTRRATLVRSVLLATGVAAGFAMVLSALAVPNVAAAQQLRYAQRTPIDSEPGGGLLAAKVIGESYGDRPLTRVLIADVRPGAPTPPGVAVLPAPGQVLLSPALVEATGRDNSLRARFPGTPVGMIGSAGLVAPDELLAYVGLSRDQFVTAPRPVAGFGTTDQREVTVGGRSPVEQWLTPERLAGTAFAVFLVAPLLVMLATCARLSATVRDRRLAALRLLGATTRQAQAVNVADTVLTALAGTGLGYLLFRTLATFSQGWSIGRFHWFSDDVRVSPVTTVVVGILVVVLAGIVAVLGVRRGLDTPLQARRGGPDRPPRPWWTITTVTALAYTLTAPALPFDQTQTLAGLAAAAVVLIVAVPASLPLLLHTLARLAGSWRAPTVVGLITRRLRHTPGIAPRLVATLVAAFLAAGFGAIGLLGLGIWQQPGNRHHLTQLPYTTFGVTPDQADNLRHGPWQTALYGQALGVDPATPDQYYTILTATCPDLATLFHGTTGCTENRTYRVDGTPLAPGVTVHTTNVLTEHDEGDLPVPASTLPLRSQPRTPSADLVITSPPTVGTLLALVPPDTVEQYLSTASAATPAATVQGYRNIAHGLDTEALLTLLATGMLISLAVGLLAYTVAAVDYTLQARRRNAPLAILGTPPRLLAATEAGTITTALLLGLITATITLTAATASWSHVAVDTADLTPWLRPIAVTVTATLALCLATVTIAALTGTRLSPDLLRHE